VAQYADWQQRDLPHDPFIHRRFERLLLPRLRGTVAVKDGMVRGAGTASETASGEWVMFDRQRS